jgi:hypothetical protein
VTQVNDSLEAINTKDRLARLIDEALAEVSWTGRRTSSPLLATRPSSLFLT